MPFLPTPGDVQVDDEVLTNFAVARMNQPGAHFALRAAPPVRVNKQSGKYPVWDSGDMNRDTVRKINPGDEYPIETIRLSNDSYFCEVRKDSGMIPDELRANAVSSVQLDRSYTEALMNKFLIRQDRDFVSTFVAASVWTGSTTAGDITPSNGWNDEASGTPRADIDAQADAVSTKMFPRNELVLLIGRQGFDHLKRHPDFTSLYEGTGSPIPNLLPSMIASVLEINEVIVCESSYTSSEEGATDTFARIFPNDVAVLMHRDQSEDINAPSAAKTFVWGGMSNASDVGVGIENYRRGERDSDQLKARTAWDSKLVSSLGGAYFTNIVQ